LPGVRACPLHDPYRVRASDLDLVGYHGVPGTDALKMMVRDPRWKYIFFANGGREQLFDLGRTGGQAGCLRTLTFGRSLKKLPNFEVP
jgi:hypothetical protein